jgi:hypothetical protein
MHANCSNGQPSEKQDSSPVTGLKEALEALELQGKRFALASIKDGKIKGRVFDTLESAEPWLDAQEGRAVYITLNPISVDFSGIRPKASDVSESPFLLVDLDPTDECPDPMPVARELWDEIGGILVDSGRGAQIWLKWKRAQIAQDLA